jgi:tetratricopeptide (TPR) repeat protein
MNRTCAPPLRRIVHAAVGPTLVWGLVLLVCGCGRGKTSEIEAPLNRAEFDPADLNEAAKISAQPIQTASRPQSAQSAVVAGLRSAQHPDRLTGETQAEFQLSPNALSSTATDSEPLDAIRLPPVEDPNDTDAAELREQSEPLAEGDSGSGAPGPTLPNDVSATRKKPQDDDKSTSGQPALPPDFAAAFAVQPKRTIAAEDRLAPLSGPSDPTPALIAVARQADTHIAQGFALAQRGATYTARAEFLRALRLSVAALDEQRQTVAHWRAMNNGLRAMEEAEEFLSAAAAGHTPSIETIVAGHQTPILHDESLEELTPSQAMQRYLTYAQDQLAAAAGDLQPAATALYALGKLEITATSAEIGSLAAARAAVYFQAALIVNAQHALAANELGVLFAGHGRLEEAKAALLHSVRTAPQVAAWRNLAIVHHRLGEHDLAGRADWESRQVAGARQTGRGATEGKPWHDATTPAVVWVDPATFAKSTNGTSGVPPPATAPQPTAQAGSNAAQAAAKSNTKSASRWWPWPRNTH